MSENPMVVRFRESVSRRKTKRPRRWWCGSEINKRRKVCQEVQVGVEVEAANLPETSAFEEYYGLQELFDKAEWDLFTASLGKPLPVTFRVNRALHDASLVETCLEEFEPLLHPKDMRKLIEGDMTFPPPIRLDWCDGYQLGIPRGILKIGTGDYVQGVKAWLQKWGTLSTRAHSGAGVITRQELASMIPAALLGIRPHHIVLDMCAAPGSKTLQALEALHRGCEADCPTGLVVANDLDAPRAYGLAARCATAGACCRSLVVTTHRAQTFPHTSHRAPSNSAASDGGGAAAAAAEQGGYDRIICDVPCSGDGTIRKDPKVSLRRDDPPAPCRGQTDRVTTPTAMSRISPRLG